MGAVSVRPASAPPAITIAVPTGTVQNDVMIASIGFRPNTATITPPAGWTLVRRIDNATANANSLAVYRRVAGAAEPASYTWTLGGGATGAAGGIQTFFNIDTATPINVENGQTTASALTHATPNVTTSAANTMVVTSHTFSSSATWTPPAGMTEAYDRASLTVPDAGGQAIEGSFQPQAAAGATGAKTATASGNADVGNAHILALRPAPQSSITINKPTGTVQNDVMIATIGFRPNTLTITTVPVGWTLVRRVNNANATANSLAVYRLVAGASEPASYTWTFSATGYLVGGILTFSGVDTTTPIDVENGNCTLQGSCATATLSHATPSVTTTVANTMLVTSHTYSSAGVWTPPAGMTEAVDVQHGLQSLAANYVPQAAAGATGAKTATASIDTDVGNAHILALRPAPPAAPGGFNGYDTTTAAGAITGFIRTKVAGAAISVDIIALNATRTAILTTFTGTVKVELLDASNNAGPLDANGCRPTWTVIQTLSPDPTFIAGDMGRKTISFTQPNSYPNARIRVTFPAAGPPTAIGCSTDNFAIRPNAFANFSATDNDAQTAGTARTLDNISVPGGTVHKAGRPFTVRADAMNAAGTPAITTNYTGTPTATPSACGGSGCTATFGTLTLATAFVSGQLTDNTASYSEVGAFFLQLVDSTFAAVDAGDSTPAERNIASGIINVGRFVPDHFAVALNTPEFGTACGAGGFTYVGQTFNFTVQPVITVTAENFANGTTTLYDGALWQITNASLTGKTYAAGTGTLDSSGVPVIDPVIAVTGSGTGTLTFSSGTGLFFTRTTLVAPFDAEIRLRINVIDADGIAYSANPAQFGDITASNGIAFNSGKPMRFGRLRLGNANGSQLVPLPVPLETQYWNGTAFITNIADTCTTLAGANITMANFQGNLGPLGSCKTQVPASITFTAGRGNLSLTAPGSANIGSVDLTIQLGSGTFGANSCVVGVSPPPQTTNGANRLYLQGNWTGGAFDQNPSARATFGVFKGSEEVIFIRENF